MGVAGDERLSQPLKMVDFSSCGGGMTSRKTNSNAATAQNQELRQIVIACLAATSRRETASNLSSLAVENVANSLRKDHEKNPGSQDRAPKSRTPRTKEARQVREILGSIIAMAERDAISVGNHLDHLVEHLSSIGCTNSADVEEYFGLANRTLASLYLEAAKARPSSNELTRLALRYALDARRPVEGEVGRFAFRRYKNAWEVIEYPSVAKRVPAIPLPGRLVKNVFAVRILDCLRREPPAIYALMGLIEDLLGGVPVEADGLSGSGKCAVPGRRPNIMVDLKKSIVWLNNEPVPVSNEQAHFVHLVVAAGGGWISSTEIGKSGDIGTIVGSRPDRVRKKLPPPIRDLIESAGGRGFRCVWRE